MIHDTTTAEFPPWRLCGQLPSTGPGDLRYSSIVATAWGDVILVNPLPCGWPEGHVGDHTWELPEGPPDG